MSNSTKIYRINPFNNQGFFGIVTGEVDSKPDDLNKVIVCALDARKNVTGRAVVLSTGKFTIAIGPLETGAWDITTCLLRRDGELDLTSLSAPFTYVVWGDGSVDQEPDGMVDIPPPYQN